MSYRFSEDGGPQDYVKVCVCLIHLLASRQLLLVHEVLCVRVENGSWYKKLYGFEAAIIIQFLPSICITASLIKHFEKEKKCVNLYAFLIVSQFIGE